MTMVNSQGALKSILPQLAQDFIKIKVNEYLADKSAFSYNVIAMLLSQLLSAITHCDSHPTLPLTVTSNPQDPTRYSTMDNWPF